MKRRASALLAALVLMTALLPAAGAFSDVPYGHWAWSYIARAQNSGWIQGTGGDSFAPGQSVSAAEFLTMTAKLCFPEELDAQGAEGPWYAPVWALSQRLELHEGTGVGWDQLTQPLARQDMAQIVCNALAAKGALLPQGEDAPFQDWRELPVSYRPAVRAVAALGIISGTGDGRFAPQNVMSRAEAATVLCRMADVLVPYEVIELVNVERAKEGMGPLAPDPDLMAAAQLRAQELRTSFSHTRPDGRYELTALEDVGADPRSYVRWGENIADGFSSAKSVVRAWMGSPGHRSNILTEAFTLIGVGHDGNRWVQMFGRK